MCLSSIVNARARVISACACVLTMLFIYSQSAAATKLHLKDKNVIAPAERQNEMRPRRANSFQGALHLGKEFVRQNRFAFVPIRRQCRIANGDVYGTHIRSLSEHSRK